MIVFHYHCSHGWLPFDPVLRSRTIAPTPAYTADAPPTISEISWVIAAWRALL
jgi:hypothetical protein